MENLTRNYIKKHVSEKEIRDSFVMNNGVAHIAAEVEGIDDILNRYCVDGYQFLSDEFTAFLDTSAQFIPKGSPLVLEITGHEFTPQEKKYIEDAVWNHYEIQLMVSQKKRRNLLIKIIWFALCLVLSALAMSRFDESINAVASELSVIALWFFGDGLISSVLEEQSDTAAEHMRLAQFASMKVIFTDSYVDEDFTDDEVKMYVEEIKENTESTEI